MEISQMFYDAQALAIVLPKVGNSFSPVFSHSVSCNFSSRFLFQSRSLPFTRNIIILSMHATLHF